ncbi:MAG: phosphate signaling complex protein PhoU [Caldilineae bacterium]|nr:phosphate signaling complex protein PhoU [Anaerolineae bacterium]MCB0254572.1 phosphate signaling complex protein PhoU [Anaerolineae bacterium]MCB9140595.1 phosphate signaling complex protein PhoU [Caldilineaceae bacterium]MCB9153049.1 phosphate signaling complex protein PhoU [Caldilineae bacterium]
MTRESFDLQLDSLQESLLALSSMVEEALLESVENLKRRDVAASRMLIKRDKEIDNRRYAIELEALTLIATQQPMAGDMRRLAATLFIANELERIGDYAKGMSRVNIRIGDESLMKPLIDIPRMAAIGQSMIHRAMEAFVTRNVELAYAVIDDDEAVDALHDQIYAELMTLLFQDVSKIRQANLLLMAAHNLERAADRATNISERAIYSVTGEMIDYGWENDVS